MDLPPGPPPGSPHPAVPPPPAASNARTLSMMCHLSSFAGFFVPLGNVWGPMVFWLVKKDEIPDVDLHGKESLNFQISMTIYIFVSVLLSLLLIGIPILVGLTIYWIVAVILASVRANNGELYRYPLTIRFIT